MRGHALSLVVLILFVTATGTAVATDNTPPLPAAGVDQTVTPGTTVYLDASGSTDPDGEITGVEWTIDTPGGTNQTPDCATCTQTQFEATTVGQYTVTLSVTDDDGATSSDTLYVTVEDEDGPSVSLSGPTTATRGSSTTLTASADEAAASLESLSWVVDGEVVFQESVSGESTSSSFTNSFSTTRNVSVSVVVYDTLGYRGTATRTVRVEDGGGGGGDSGCTPGVNWCGEGDARVQGPGGPTVIMDTNDQPGIQSYNDEGELVTVDDPASSPGITERDGAYVVDDDTTSNDALDNTDTMEQEETQSGGYNGGGGGDSGGDSGGGGLDPSLGGGMPGGDWGLGSSIVGGGDSGSDSGGDSGSDSGGDSGGGDSGGGDSGGDSGGGGKGGGLGGLF